MRSGLIIVSLALLSSCALFQGLDPQRPILPPVPRSLQITGTVKIDCYNKDHQAATNANRCDKGIPVKIEFMTNREGKRVCVAVLGYKELVVHTAQKRTKVVWEIDGPAGYEFATRDSDGKLINGIWLLRQKNPSDPTKPGAIYDGFGMDNAVHKRRYKAEVLPGAPEKKSFDHGANVIGPDGPCEPWDPIIINQDN